MRAPHPGCATRTHRIRASSSQPVRPGLEFGSTGRLDNQASGFFRILEVTYGGTGEVLTFAADFTHYGETNPNNFAVVELRYNATIVPEPLVQAAW